MTHLEPPEETADDQPESSTHDSMEEADRANGEGDPEDAPKLDEDGKRVRQEPSS